MPLLSVIVPIYNEAKTIRAILEKINSIGIDKEIIIVDNYSTDGTRDILRDILKEKEFYGITKVIYHSYNKGKGTSVRAGIQEAQGEFVVIQDADLEYDPSDYLRLIEAIREHKADIVLGARFKKGHQGLFMHKLGNRLLTGLLNFLFNCRLNDYATCYKLARRCTFYALNLKAAGFNIEAEIICKALKKKKYLLEVPISYSPRTYAQGKKIRWLDGLWAIFYMFKYRFTN